MCGMNGMVRNLRLPLRFSFSMIKRRENEGGKAFFGFLKLVLTMSLFTDKNLTQTTGSNDINIYLLSFTIRNR